MKIFNTLFLLFCFIIFCGQNITGAPFHYIVKGEIKGHDGMSVKMTDYGKNQLPIDSTIIKNGSFTMEGEYDRHALVRFQCGRESYSNCILDTLTIPNFETHLPEPSSHLNTQYSKFSEQMDNMSDKIMEYAQELQNNPDLSDEEKNDMFLKFREENFPLYKEFFTEIIVDNPNGIGEHALWFGLSDIDISPSDWDEIYPMVPGEIKELPLTVEIDNQYQAMKKTMPGAKFIDVVGKSADGSIVHLSDYVGKGKYVLVDFWASWCGPCIEEGKNFLIPLYEKYKDNDYLEIVGVATLDNIDKTKERIEQQGYKWSQILDAGQQPLDLYGFTGIPMIMLFGPDGLLLERNIRGQEIEKAILKHVPLDK